jgi:hypothetical protein
MMGDVEPRGEGTGWLFDVRQCGSIGKDSRAGKADVTCAGREGRKVPEEVVVGPRMRGRTQAD